MLFKWIERNGLGSTGLIVCFWLFEINFRPILAQFRHKMAKYELVKLVSKILDLFWTNFGSVLEYLRAKFGASISNT